MSLLYVSTGYSVMSTISVILLVCTIIFAIIEALQPGMGIFGVLALFAFTIFIVLRIIIGTSPIWLALISIAIIAFFIVLILIVAKSARSGKLSKTGFVLTKNSLPYGMTDGTRDFSFLLNKEGIIVSELKPTGKAQIEDIVYEVVSETSVHIETDVKVKVVSVEGRRIGVNIVK